MKGKSLIYALLGVLILGLGSIPLNLSSSANGSNNSSLYRYKFVWGLIPVANLEIGFSEFDSKKVVMSKGATEGLSRLLKNYSAQVSVQEDSLNGNSYYELIGLDRGSREVRKILFEHGEAPKLIEFLDRTAPSGLKVQKALDLGSVDPLTVFSWFFSEQVGKRNCNQEFRVFDGKKRFLIKAQIMEDHDWANDPIDKMISCRITMVGRSVEASKEGIDRQDKAVTFWPFNRKDLVIDVMIGRAKLDSFYIRDIRIYTPIGKIDGRLEH